MELLFILVVALFLFFLSGIVAGSIASSKGRSFFGYFLVGTVLPLIGIVWAIGMSDRRKSTGADVQGAEILTNVFPFNGQRNLVQITGDGAGSHVANISARRGIGNILVTGSIGTINANSDRRNVRGEWDGIAGPIYAAGGSTTNADFGNIVSVIIGEGMLPSGTGAFSRSGIYADNIIDSVRSNTPGADIRGTIAAAGLGPFVSTLVNGVLTTSLGALESGRTAFVEDATAGVAVYLDAAVVTALPVGTRVRATGTIDTRFSMARNTRWV